MDSQPPQIAGIRRQRDLPRADRQHCVELTYRVGESADRPSVCCRRRAPMAHRVSRPNPVEGSAAIGAILLTWRTLCYAFEAALTGQDRLCGWFAAAGFEPG